MISISLKKRNSASCQTLVDAMQAAMDDLKRRCVFAALCWEEHETDYPGYTGACNNCQCKQGCRDISRAYIHVLNTQQSK